MFDCSNKEHIAEVTRRANMYAGEVVSAIRTALLPVNGSAFGNIARDSTLAIMEDVEKLVARAFVVGYAAACEAVAEYERSGRGRVNG